MLCDGGCMLKSSDRFCARSRGVRLERTEGLRRSAWPRESTPARRTGQLESRHQIEAGSSGGRATTTAGSISTTACPATSRRSEEHTSELQSLAYLVCRLLLEKK